MSEEGVEVEWAMGSRSRKCETQKYPSPFVDDVKIHALLSDRSECF